MSANRTPSPQGKPCTREWHESLKLDEERWTEATHNRREHLDDGVLYEYAECLRCSSTLVREIQRLVVWRVVVLVWGSDRGGTVVAPRERIEIPSTSEFQAWADSRRARLEVGREMVDPYSLFVGASVEIRTPEGALCRHWCFVCGEWKPL